MSDTRTVRAHVFVKGRVQGVFFRDHTRSVASSLGITGWVRNLPDGRVEIVAEGPESAVSSLVAWCREDPGLADVTGVAASYEEPRGEFSGFEKRL
jgi:acylphosphatase